MSSGSIICCRWKVCRGGDVDGAVIASVVPDVNFNLRYRCAADIATPIRSWSASKGVTLGTNALVDRPEEVGADRLVNTVAAHDRYKGPLIVVDFGTATTFDVVDRDGNYCGGVIAPGINLSLHALEMAAAKLPSIRIRRTERVIGKDTVSCMQSGIYLGLCRTGRGAGAAHPGRVRRAMDVIATGGLAPLFAGATERHRPCRSRPDLVGAAPDLPPKQQQMNHPPLQPGARPDYRDPDALYLRPARRCRARSG